MKRSFTTQGITDPDLLLQPYIEEEWKTMPKPTRDFLLGTPLESLTHHAMVRFWSAPKAAAYITYLATGKMRDESFSIALMYLRLGKTAEARAAILNGSFILDALKMGLAQIVRWHNRSPDAPCIPELLYFNIAYNDSDQNPQRMEKYAKTMLSVYKNASYEYLQKDVTTRGMTSLKGNGGGHSSEIVQKPSNETSPGAQIHLILADESNTEERKTLAIKSDTNLKALFNYYANQRGASLRSLRFSYHGKRLFLSSAGNQTPLELSMKDQDIITVCNMDNAHAETNNASLTKKKKAKPKNNAKRGNKSRRNPKTKGKKERATQSHAIKTAEDYQDYRADHFKSLSRVHEEARSRLKEIRTRLHALNLECRPPKQRGASGGKMKAEGETTNDQSMSPNAGVGGKAGKPSFLVNVGEIQNLYKTTKLPRHDPCSVHTLDLHGCTISAAVDKLDESLKAWVDTAMRGSYPFVISAMIVCGCGNQVMSETVENWIKQHAQVANSPKGLY